jgi:hypothetical protein
MKSILKKTYSKIILTLLFLYTLCGFVVIPYLIQNNFSDIIKEKMSADGQLGTVYLNPFTFEITLKNLFIEDRSNNTLLYFQNLNLNFELLHLLNNEIKLEHLFIDNFKSSITLYQNNRFNFSHILDHITKNNVSKENQIEEINSKQTDNPLVFSIDSFSFTNIQLSFKDEIQSNKSDIYINSLSSQLSFTQTNNQIDFNIDKFNLQIPSFHFYDNRFDIKASELQYTIENINIKQKEVLDYTLKNMHLSNAKIAFKDTQKNIIKPLIFTDVDISSNTFTNEENKNSTLSLSLNTPKSGTLSLSSNIVQNPFNIKGKGEIKDLTIVPYQNYIKEFINLDIKNTDIDTDVNFDFKDTTQNIIANLNISNIDLYHSITKKQLLKLQTFNLEKVLYTKNNLVIDKVTLDTFLTKFKIAKDTTTNIDQLFNENKKDVQSETNTAKEKKSDFQYYIKSLILKNGKLEFSDHSLPLNFDTYIHDLNTEVDDISSKNDEATIVLQGVIDKYGLANIKANTILSNFKNKTDVTISFENLDVRSYSPYSGKFIGQKISDGRLWLDLNYQINKGQLASTNNIKIKNLTLGEDVNSNDAINLPFGLAIALLEDNEGLIDLDIPVVGDMNNPQFELGGVIWKTIGNVITNIISAPFKFLSSLLGIDSNELGEIEFNFAQSEILAPQKEKLDQLLVALKKKKQLIIVLQPAYDKEKDSAALRNQKFNQLIKSKNRTKMIEEIYLKRFSKEKFENLKSNTKKEDLPSLLSLEIKKTISIDTIELEKLAKQRVENIKEYFVSHKLTLDRIQIKNDVKEENSKDKVFSLQLELKIKDK